MISKYIELKRKRDIEIREMGKAASNRANKAFNKGLLENLSFFKKWQYIYLKKAIYND